MDERASCPHKNLPENRFYGHCATSLTSRGQLAPRPEANPAAAIRSLPTRIGLAGKALAVSLAVLATETALAWLRRRAKYDQPSPLATQTAKPAGPEHITGQSLEEVLVWLQEDRNLQGRGFARRAA